MARHFDRLSFSDTLDKYPEGVAYVTDNSLLVDCNETFRTLTGIGEGPLDRFDMVVHPSHFESWSAGLSKFLSDPSEIHEIVLRLRSEARGRCWVRVLLMPLQPQNKKDFLLILIDVSGQKNLEAKLIRAKNEAERATRSKSEFLANTSHEIRTPIHTVIGMSELLSDTTLDQEQVEYVGQIRFAADVLLSLINDILDFSKIEAGHLELERTEFHLADLLEDSLDLITLEAHRKNVDIGLYLPPELPLRVFGDPTRLRQVIVNLVNNAVKFTQEGHVILDVDVESVSNGRARLKFSVSDSGIGIPLEKQAHLFQAFQQADSSTTRRFGGTGLGLYISKSIVSQMGGNLSFESQPGKGSKFYFVLDFERADKHVSVPIVSDRFFSGHRLLVVDDNDVIRNRIARTVRAWGFQVDEAGGAIEALTFLRSAKDKGEPYDIILVDQTMPHIDGWQFASEVNSDKSLTEARMVLMSMKGGSGTVEAKMKLLGWYDAYLTKPIRQDDLAAALFRLLASDLDLEDAEEVEEVEPLEDEGLLEPVPGSCILIAEDHEVNRRLLQTILEKNGHEVLEAANGKEAFDLVRQRVPDLIFMDCQMPVMNGYESTGIIRDFGFDGPIIAVTASAQAEERDKCLNCGMSDLVTKPFKQADILMMIERYLGVGKVFLDTTHTPVPAPVLIEDDVIDLEVEEPDPSVSSAGESSGVAEDIYPGLEVFNYKAAVDTFLGNEKTVRNLLAPLMLKMENEVQQLRKSVDSADWENVRMTAHSIKGSARNMDMNRCGEAAAELEAAGKTADMAAAKQSLLRLEAEFPRLQSMVEEILQS